MKRFLLCTSAVCLLSVPVYAASEKRIDPFIKNAIQKTAAPQPEPELIVPEPDSMAEAADTEPLDLDAFEGEDGLDEEAMRNNMYAEMSKDLPPLPSPEEELTPRLPIEEAEIAVAEESPVLDDGKPGFRMGSFRLSPSVTLTETYDDNILVAPEIETDDFITVVNPVMRMELEDSDHKAMVEAAYKGSFYASNSDEDTQDFHVKTEGAFKTGENAFLPFELGFVLGHEAREDDLQRQLPTEKIETQTITAGTGIEYKKNKVGLAVLGRYVLESFDDGTDVNGNAVVRSDADRTTWEVTAKASYDFEDNVSVYGAAIYGDREYDKKNYQGGGFNGPFRHSDFYEFKTGIISSYGNFAEGEVSVGYKNWEHDDPSLNSVEDFTFHADLDVNFTPETVLGIAWDRGLWEDAEVMGIMQATRTLVSLDHHLSDKFTIGTAASYEGLEYGQSQREDETYGLGFYGSYDINDNFTAGLEYNIDSRDTSSAAFNNFEYDRQRIMARIKGRL